MKDPIVENMIAKIRQRSERGQEKYGKTLQAEVDLDVKNFLDYITDLEEELFDAIIYIQAFKQAMKKSGFKHLKFTDEDK